MTQITPSRVHTTPPFAADAHRREMFHAAAANHKNHKEHASPLHRSVVGTFTPHVFGAVSCSSSSLPRPTKLAPFTNHSPVSGEVQGQSFPLNNLLSTDTPRAAQELGPDKLREGFRPPGEILPVGIVAHHRPTVRGDDGAIRVQDDQGRDSSHPELGA